MPTRKTLVGNGANWPTFESPINLELYDAEDDEACHQAAANAATWLKERACKVKDVVTAIATGPYGGETYLDWHDTDISTILVDQIAGDIITAHANFEAYSGDLDEREVQYRLAITDGAGTTGSRPIKEIMPAAGYTWGHYGCIAQRAVGQSGTVTITVQIKHSHDTGETTFLNGGTILPIVERRKADD